MTMVRKSGIVLAIWLVLGASAGRSQVTDPTSLFQGLGCTVEDHLQFTVAPSDVSLGAIYGSTINALTNGASPGAPRQSFGRLHGCVSTEPERDEMQYSGVQKSLPVIWVLRDIPACSGGIRSFEGRISTDINHFMTSTFYDTVKGNSTWFVKTFGRFYGSPYANPPPAPPSDFKVPATNLVSSRACLLKYAAACASSPALTQGALDLLGIHVENGLCVDGPSFPFVSPREPPVEPPDTFKDLGPGQAGGGVQFPAPDGPDLDALHAVGAAHHAIMLYSVAYADWYDSGQVGPSPVKPVSRVQQTMTKYVALSAAFVDRHDLVRTATDGRGRRLTRDDWVLKLQHYRQLLPFGGTDPTQTPREVADWQVLAHRDHHIWGQAQESDRHLNQWEEVRDADKQHFNDHICQALKGSTVLPRFRCAGDGVLKSCPTMTCDEYLASQVDEVTRLTEEARALLRGGG